MATQAEINKQKEAIKKTESIRDYYLKNSKNILNPNMKLFKANAKSLTKLLSEQKKTLKKMQS